MKDERDYGEVAMIAAIASLVNIGVNIAGNLVMYEANEHYDGIKEWLDKTFTLEPGRSLVWK